MLHSDWISSFIWEVGSSVLRKERGRTGEGQGERGGPFPCGNWEVDFPDNISLFLSSSWTD